MKIQFKHLSKFGTIKTMFHWLLGFSLKLTFIIFMELI